MMSSIQCRVRVMDPVRFLRVAFFVPRASLFTAAFWLGCLGLVSVSLACLGESEESLSPTEPPATAVVSIQPTPVGFIDLSSGVQEPVGSSGSDQSPWDVSVAVVEHAEPSIRDHALTENVIWAAVGSTITWHNDDDVQYAIASDDAWFDGYIEPGGTFTWQPKESGMYSYHVDDDLAGRIIVPQGGAVAPQYYGGKSVRAYYLDSCSGCHGPERKGATGPALLPETLPDSDEFYHNIILRGQAGTVMPAWDTLGLSDEEAWGLVSFLKSISTEEVLQWDLSEISNTVETLTDESTLPSSPTHSGNIANLMLVTEREHRSIALIDGDTHELIKHIPASYRAHGYTFNPVEERWAYNLGRDGWIFKIDLYTAQAVRRVRVGHDSRGLAISDDGKYLIAGNYLPHTAVILDAETLDPLKVINAEGVDPDGEMVESRIAITSDVAPSLVGPYFIIALKEAGQVWRIDYSDPDFPIEKIENVGRILHDGFLSPDNRYFYIASQIDDWMTVIDVEAAEIVERINTGDTPHPGSGATWEHDGVIYGATVHAGEGKVSIWDLETNVVVGDVGTSGPGLFIRSHDHSPYVWADALFGSPANTITVFEKSPPFDTVMNISDGVMTLHPEFTADGRFVYISDWLGDRVRVYDAETFEMVAELEGIQTPTGIFNTSRREETLGH